MTTEQKIIEKQKELIETYERIFQTDSLELPESEEIKSELAALEKELEQEPEGMTAEEILKEICGYQNYHSFELDDELTIREALEAMESYAKTKEINMPTEEEIRTIALKRHPINRPRNYLSEGQRLGFVECGKWMRDEIIKRNK